ncbi:hypothetical protein [Enterococcus sp. AZ101]|uniref:hypothetical protein n=1 Tax=Enterococcus sp. AZ101 TaxID=2774742 RepID=UPI003D287AC9
MKVITVSGKPGTGKTTVLGRLHTSLIGNKGYTSILKQDKHSEDTPSTVSIDPSSVSDHIYIFEKQIPSDKSKKIRIGLMTEGDFPHKIPLTLNYFLKENCDYAILASRIGANFNRNLSSVNGYYTSFHKDDNTLIDNDKVLKLLTNLIP